MEMHQVRYFLAVAEHLNFTRAAERLHVAQPSLTRAIQKLEDELGGPLFRRERVHTHLTELGRLMRPHLQAALEAAETAKRQAQSFRKRETGQLTIGACSSIAAETGAPLLAGVSAEIAGLTLQVEIGPANLVEDWLIAGDVDAALLAPLDGVAVVRHERFDLRRIAEDLFCVAFAPGHRFEALTEVVLENLDGEPLIVRLGCRHEEAIAAAMDARGINRVARHSSGDERWLASLVRQGLGCILWPESITRARSLPFRPLADLPLRHRVALTTVAGRRHSPALAALVRQADVAGRRRPSDAARVA
ncbi:LysR family transcriptional regulator [Methylobacterium isbiliense]|uniref:HTH-type transcriptional regulator HdfR n=1 Tax=Methylobacterium isbiliense TaxID=315478 RepID=A0ABQ4SMA5_9HYPH|nr:LysR family transcriptional regulator [Methylobacterium isbiliense]MDN3626387.1 LysR family transcriptional regulator [Methylobacterium isbiliense]GJE03023.1 HTH-type transcriptional regulator HdfR [Methylobacterium isbiliense]